MKSSMRSGNEPHTQITAKQQSAQQNSGFSPQNSPDSALTVQQTELRWVSGPIPSADELGKYESVLPGAAERLLAIHERQILLVEKQAHHRFALENSVVSHNNNRSYLGLVVGGIVVLAGFWLSYEFAMHHDQLLAGGTFFVDLSSLAGMFVYGTESQRKERAERLKALLPEHKGSSAAQ